MSLRPPEAGALATGSRVLLRTFTSEDISPRYISWLNDKQIMKYSSQRFVAHTSASCADYLGSFEDSPNLFVAIVDRETREMVGTMTAYISADGSSADLGILVGAREALGKGIGTEAWVLLMRYVRKSRNVSRITAGTLADNRGMQAIAKKSGMRHVATKLISQSGDSEAREAHFYEFEYE